MGTQHKTVAVLGAGSWGTALAIHLARAGLNVRLWGYHPEHVEVLQKERCNQRYLPGVAFPENLELYSSLEDALRGGELLVLVVIPSHAYRSFLKSSSSLKVRSDHSPVRIPVNLNRHVRDICRYLRGIEFSHG